MKLSHLLGALALSGAPAACDMELTTDGAPAVADGALLSAWPVGLEKLGQVAAGQLVELNETLFFSGAAPGTGAELWMSDGTPEGTVLVKDINPGYGSSNPSYLTAFGGIVLFVADDGVSGMDLWRSDGTANGTFRIADFGYDARGPFVAYQGAVYFRAGGGLYGYELWETDGTAAGTKLFADLCPGACWGAPTELVATASYLFFAAEHPSYGRELWRTNGTTAGTVMLKDLYPGTTGSTPIGLFAHNGIVYFKGTFGASGSELGRSDGTAAGTVVRDVVPGGYGSDPQSFAVLGGSIYFTAKDGVHGREVWKMTAGNLASAALFADINPGYADSYPMPFTAWNGRLYFGAQAQGVPSLWTTDGSTTQAVKALNIQSSEPIAIFQGQLYFQAFDVTAGAELWKSNGTTAGTQRVADINPGTNHSSPYWLTPVGPLLYFTAVDANGPAIWVLDAL